MVENNTLKLSGFKSGEIVCKGTRFCITSKDGKLINIIVNSDAEADHDGNIILTATIGLE
jgi:hypothetical protein